MSGAETVHKPLRGEDLQISGQKIRVYVSSERHAINKHEPMKTEELKEKKDAFAEKSFRFSLFRKV